MRFDEKKGHLKMQHEKCLTPFFMYLETIGYPLGNM